METARITTDTKTSKTSDSLARAGRMGRILIEAGKLNEIEMAQVLHAQKKFNLRFGDAAIKLGLVKEEDILLALSQQFNYDSLSLNSDLVEPEIVVAFRSNNVDIESFRSLRSQLTLRWLNEHKSLIVTSAKSGQGSSHVVANLAVLFAQLGKKTFLIDANMRKPRQHTLFKLSNKQGLSDVLAGRAGSESIQSIDGFDHLRVLTSGTSVPNPLELLARSRFWDKAEKIFDVILIDTPPTLEYSDAQSLAAEHRGVLVVARQNEAKLADIESIREQTSITGSTLVGVVINEF